MAWVEKIREVGANETSSGSFTAFRMTAKNNCKRKNNSEGKGKSKGKTKCNCPKATAQKQKQKQRPKQMQRPKQRQKQMRGFFASLRMTDAEG